MCETLQHRCLLCTGSGHKEEDCEKHSPQKLYNLFKAYAAQGAHTSLANLDSAWGYDDSKLVESLDRLVIVRHNESGRAVIYERRDQDDIRDLKRMFDRAVKEINGEIIY